MAEEDKKLDQKLEMFNLVEYEEYIKNLSDNNSSDIFYNSSPRHAQIVLTKIIEKTQKHLCIYCGNMTTFEIFDNPDYLNALKNYLNKENVQVEILLSDYQDAFFKKDIYKLLYEHKDKVVLKKTWNKDEIKFDNNPIHFTLSDDKTYRLETDIEKKIAIGNFNDAKTVEVLKGTFYEYFKVSENFTWKNIAC